MVLHAARLTRSVATLIVTYKLFDVDVEDMAAWAQRFSTPRRLVSVHVGIYSLLLTYAQQIPTHRARHHKY